MGLCATALWTRLSSQCQMRAKCCVFLASAGDAVSGSPVGEVRAEPMRDSQRHQRAPKFSEQYSEFLHAISKSHTWFEEPDGGAGVDEIDEENEQTDSGETDDYSDTTLESLVEDGQDVSNVSFQWFHPGDVSVAPRDNSQQFLTVAAYQQLAKQSMEAATPVGHQHEKVA